MKRKKHRIKPIFLNLKKEHKKRILLILFCAAALAVLIVPAVFVNSLFGYLPVILAVLMTGASYGYLLLLKRALFYEELSDLSNCQRGTNIDFTVRLKNKSPLIFTRLKPSFYISDLFGEDDTVTEEIITLTPFEERNFQFSVRFDHIGSYSAGLKKIQIFDLLGLFSYTIENKNDYQVNVKPKIFDVASLKISNTALTESEKMIVPTVIDGSDYAGVREYVWGDPIKTIHWKLSARTETYMTKQFESYGTVGLSIILDFYSPKYDSETLMSIFDSIVETGLSVADYAKETGLEYELVYNSRHGERKKFSAGYITDLMELIGDMPQITVAEEGEQKALKLLREEGNARYSHGNIAFCSANITEEMTNVLLELKNRKKNPILFAIVPDSLRDEERDKFLRPLRILDNARIAFYILSSAEELGGGEKV